MPILSTRRRISFVIISSILVVSTCIIIYSTTAFSDYIAFSESEHYALDAFVSNAHDTLESSFPFAANPDGLTTPSVCHDTELELASTIYVVSLPTRQDRRASMNRLRNALSVEWTYTDSTPSSNAVIQSILENLTSLRRGKENVPHAGADYEDETQFSWPVHFNDSTTLYNIPVAPKAALHEDKFSLPDVHLDSGSTGPALTTSSDSLPSISSPDPLTCASGNSVLGVPYHADTPKHMLLTPAKVACWYSHLQVIRHIASSYRRSHPDLSSTCTNVTLVLEDDVDMEEGIKGRLKMIWEAVPGEWDILYLGHCWSDESHFPAVPLRQATLPSKVPSAGPLSISGNETSLHPSYAPKCTHAYALNPIGAFKILQHLTYSPFAYSRALDQALAWLIQSGRIKAYSVVPSLIVQRKKSKSDVDRGETGFGSTWKENLVSGILERLETER